MHHVIVQSEMSVRMEADRLRRENADLTAEVNRLRALVGEPPLEVKAAAKSAQADMRTFVAGDCRVAIGHMPTPGISPAARGVPSAAARAQVAPAPAQQAQPQQNLATDEAPRVQIVRAPAPGQSSQGDDSSARFSLLELDR